MQRDKTNVLIFPAGSEIGLEIFNSLKYNLHINLFGASGKADHAKFLYNSEHYFEGDFYINSTSFFEKINAVIERNKIDFIIPTHDSIAYFLADNKKKIKASVITSPVKTAKIAREKKLTYELFRGENFCPKVFESPESVNEYPVFIKPNLGQGSHGATIINTRTELKTAFLNSPNIVISEYLPGEEITVDCFTNKNSELLFIGPRIRERIEMGISFTTSRIPLSNEIKAIAVKLNLKMEFRGAWFFQLKKDNAGNYKLLEFAVRQSSTMALYRQLGVNFALLSIFDALGMEIEILSNDLSITLDRALNNKYKLDIVYDRVYIDFDDTIIVNDTVNPITIQFLYQCRKQKINTILITKHEFNLDDTLERYCISKNLFDDIIILQPKEDKWRHIEAENSIFIDNYFFDRRAVRSNLNIPVFDVDAIECLLN